MLGLARIGWVILRGLFPLGAGVYIGSKVQKDESDLFQQTNVDQMAPIEKTVYSYNRMDLMTKLTILAGIIAIPKILDTVVPRNQR